MPPLFSLRSQIWETPSRNRENNKGPSTCGHSLAKKVHSHQGKGPLVHHILCRITANAEPIVAIATVVSAVVTTAHGTHSAIERILLLHISTGEE
jgi:hypothetical protein